MKLVDKNSQIPLYIQLIEILKDMINTNKLQEGHYLMSERDICKIQNVSRMTVNKAIINLVNEGVLERRQGKGTFVSYKKQKLTYEKMQSFTEIANEKKLKVKNEILKFRLDKPNDVVKEYLQIKDDSLLVFHIERVRFVDDDPTILEKIYIPEYMCPDLNEDLINKNSLYKLYREKYMHKTQRAKQIINPIALDKTQSKLLNVDLNSLALKIDRVVFTDKKDVLEYTSSLFITDKHQYEVILNED
ncbi:MAG TPA: GntR family transcriptional regulator [Terrisporobacter glycolicus]|uniref:GntR family transcriptional regulator n=1 Tax=Terrisporobacter TaxID=1505652 RepID=UPI000E85E77E|nr:MULTISPECIES: GntR family transcriptional regulator [Terrisporobacter]MBN9647436.1 GntR family transcriptional regulator [Terrisporobacter glycolicus]HBI92288.1 GntR family transcriptional regulator [Terrisporobacter hibernicus]